MLSLVTRAGEHLFRSPELIDNSLHPVTEVPDVGNLSDGALGSWINWGGDKTWPAPQGWSGPDEWPGPPDPVLDGGPYSASWTADRASASVEMCSPDDRRSGLRICRRVDVTEGSSGYRLTNTFTNTSDREVRWAIWQVVQLPGSPPAAFDRDEIAGLGVWVCNGSDRATVEDLIVVTEHVKVDQTGTNTLWVPPQDVVGKVGFPTAAGWVAHAGAERVTVLRFSPESGATYPDRGSRVEVWLEYPLSAPLLELGGLRPGHRVVECEILGPLRTMPPGSSTQLVIDVAGCSGEGPVCGVQAEACLLGPLAATGDRSGLHVTGRIGVFRSGEVSLDLLGPSGDVLSVTRLGQISAGNVLEVRLPAEAPSETASVVLRCGGSVLAHEPVRRPGTSRVNK